MPDLLTHVLVAYSLATALSFRYEWLTPQYVTVAMVGAIVPDLTKISILVPSAHVEALLGIPFDWGAIHTLGGSLVALLIGALLVSKTHRRRVFLLLVLGAASHLMLDAANVNASGYSYPVLWPLTTYQPPTPNLWLSSDRWPALVSGVVAAAVWYLRYHWYEQRDG